MSSKPFDYSKWDNIELSDDEDDVHPNIDRESWFRMKHRSRVEREDREETEKKRIGNETAAANLRIKEIKSILKRLSSSNADSDDELEDEEGLEAELKELLKKNEERQARLDDFEKNRKWNVDNMCSVVEERTMVNPKGIQPQSNDAGFVIADDIVAENEDGVDAKSEMEIGNISLKDQNESNPAKSNNNKKTSESSPKKSGISKSSPSKSSSEFSSESKSKKSGPSREQISMLSYAQFTDKYTDILEKFMALRTLEQSKQYLLSHGDILLQENASNYLLLASLEDEMNGLEEKMKLTARQSQVLSNITELAKSIKQHPGNVIIPFFKRMEEREHFGGFCDGVNVFIARLKKRAIEKRKEMNAHSSPTEQTTEVDLKDIPLEERLGPGGLDPVEVFESIPVSMQAAFESRDTEVLKKVLMEMDIKDAEYHMKRCVDSGLWNDNS